MGGNALDFDTRRVNRKEYFEMRGEVLGLLREHTKDGERVLHDCRDIIAYRTKETFGDLDILVETKSGDSVDYEVLIRTLFSPRQIVHNSNCYSFDYKDFQVDLILTSSEDFGSSYIYFAWNDLGNLMGRIYKKLGFKYGHKGLSYIFRDQDNKYNAFAEVVVSKDLRKILKFGDFDYYTFLRGFDTLENMFLFVASSKYFHPDIFLLENRNHVSRTRDKKRKVYNEFLSWCKVTLDLNRYPWKEMREQDGYAGKPKFLRLALKTFEGFDEVHAHQLAIHECDKRVKAKFNGEVIRNLTGLEGKELGVFMQYMIESFGGKHLLWTKLLHATHQQIDAWIKTEQSNYLLSTAFKEIEMFP